MKCNEIEITGSNFSSIEKMVSQYYEIPKKDDVNQTRYKRCYRVKIPEPHQLPLTKDELMLDKLLLHMNRMHYQLHIWEKNFSSKFLH